ncbi:helix-turn-helix transcriptional regulator [uncultured Winogradskyella sp.]|uniref:helix-turn-helix domain-containing protein n=1 Tax=uncultured Winogradskyella sp. TaxID=395353 RepID=UPI0026384111|nr:helix-turn-helix transcriptional regulator [uncultured Winogradskyella sp.]
MNRLIGIKIKELRKEQNYSQEEVADMLNISQATYSRIENGSTSAWINYIDRLSDLYKIAIDDFLKLDKIIPQNQSEEDGLMNRLIEQYETRLKEKDILIRDLNYRIDKLINKIN